ncbi:MAG: hypothetical protein M3P43_11780 [Actinomycetota bacterium]|nr:hypothetical protein [Actinomycetota bacterium]
MSRLVVTGFMTLDGVMEAPGFEEHRDGKNAWAIQATTKDQQPYKVDELFAAGAILLGRVSSAGGPSIARTMRPWRSASRPASPSSTTTGEAAATAGTRRRTRSRREVEDAGAVIEAAGGTANLWGSSSGAALALICAEQGLSI